MNAHNPRRLQSPPPLITFHIESEGSLKKPRMRPASRVFEVGGKGVHPPSSFYPAIQYISQGAWVVRTCTYPADRILDYRHCMPRPRTRPLWTKSPQHHATPEAHQARRT